MNIDGECKWWINIVGWVVWKIVNLSNKKDLMKNQNHDESITKNIFFEWKLLVWKTGEIIIKMIACNKKCGVKNVSVKNTGVQFRHLAYTTFLL